MLNGILLGKKKNSPYFRKDGAAIAQPQVLPSNEVAALRQKLGFSVVG